MVKKLLYLSIFTLFVTLLFHKNVYSSEESHNKPIVASHIQKSAPMKDDNIKVNEIGYDEFIKMRKSAQKYILLDARGADSYKSGHIEGALSFPLKDMDETNAKTLLKKDSKIIVYCASFGCHASTAAAKKLLELGYKNVVDYKGGIKEWTEKGNKLVKS